MLNYLAYLFKHIPEDEARKMKMTHSSTYYLIPIYVGVPRKDGDDISYCTKRPVFEFLFSIVYKIETILQLMFVPTEDIGANFGEMHEL